MAKEGFVLNYAAVAKLLKSAESAAAVRAAAQQVLTNTNDPNATIVEYTTDRAVAGVQIDAADQARNGTGTRAAGQAGLTPGS